MNSDNPYESRKLLNEYLLFHYGTHADLLTHPNGPAQALDFAMRTVTETLPDAEPVSRSLDVGCAVGRSAFELSRFCDEVIAIDFSAAFIEAAQQIQRDGSAACERLDEGSLTTQLRLSLPAGIRPANVQFETGDATALRADLGAFDIVHAANLICRLPEPMRFLDRLQDLVRPGGRLVLATPCTWLGEFTPPENWPKGRTLDWLQESLSSAFTLDRSMDMPFLIRETARKFQWTVAQASVWTRT